VRETHRTLYADAVAGARARSFDYGITLDDAWRAASDRGGDPLPHDEQAWTPEHLLLVALARCTLTSLGYHARRSGLTAAARASARGTVTARESDGRFAFVDVEVTIDVTLTPSPGGEDILALLQKAERDCFVGASLALAPVYRWNVNGQEPG
jgi:organic hydroperoxide reductase OsmC/OhrA